MAQSWLGFLIIRLSCVLGPTNKLLANGDVVEAMGHFGPRAVVQRCRGPWKNDFMETWSRLIKELQATPCDRSVAKVGKARTR